jgi:LysM repeat protein
MTRETKIGLLVGLAFILIVGILLSEHVTRATEPPQATLVNAGSTVREGVGAPGATSNQPPITTITSEQLQPRQPVPTQPELRQLPTPGNVVVVGPTPTPTPAPAVPAPAPQPEPISPTPAQPVTASPLPKEVVAQPTPTPSPWDALDRTARTHGEELVPVDTRARQPGMPGPIRVDVAPPAPTGTREYLAEAGDNLHKIALKTMGASTKANRDAIVRLNPSLQQSPDRIIVGQRYLVPAVVGGTPATGNTQVAGNTQSTSNSPQTDRANPPARPATANPQPTRVASADYAIYEVQPGDSLWRIAVQQTGSPAGIKVIRELNADVLTSDAVRVGMKLKIPKPPAGHSTARAN